MLTEYEPVCVVTTGSGVAVAEAEVSIPARDSHAPLSTSLSLWEQDARPEGLITDVRPVSRHVRGARSVFLDGSLDESSLRGLMVHFERWVSEPTYLAFYDCERDEYLFRQASKRGNSLYSARVQERISDATCFLSSPGFEGLVSRREGRGYVCNAFFITLSCDVNGELFDRTRAWMCIQGRYNSFISAFRGRYGRVFALKSFESSCEGYPHIHLLVILEKPLPVFEYNGVWRLKSKRSLEKLWPAFMDVRAVGPGRRGVKSVKNYLMKDIIKQARHEPGLDFSQTNLSLALNWLFRKRSFSVSDASWLYDLINDVGITQTGLLSFSLVCSSDLRFLGCFRLCFACEPPDRPFFSSVSGDLVRKDVVFSYVREREVLNGS